MAKTINITTTSEGNLSYSQSGEEEIIITTPVNLWVDPTSVSFRIDSEVRSMSLSDVITINSVAFSGTLDELKTTVEGLLPTASGGSGGSGTIHTWVDSNGDEWGIVGVTTLGALITEKVTVDPAAGTQSSWLDSNGDRWAITGVATTGALITSKI